MSLPRLFRAPALSLSLLLVVPFCFSASAQSAWQPGAAGIGFGKAPSKQWVQMVSSPDVVVNAGSRSGAQPASVAVTFAIQTGLHINSHTPHSQYLIPTTLKFDQPSGAEVARVEYPAGVDYHFNFSPNDAVSVYTGQFGVLLQVHAKPGQYILQGQLHYQACDSRACNPPRTLPVTLHLVAK